jgi:hypothetical protein
MNLEKRIRDLEARRPRVPFVLCDPPDPTKPRPTRAGKSDLVFRFVEVDRKTHPSFRDLDSYKTLIQNLSGEI